MQNDLGWGTFLVWAVFNTVIAVAAAIFLKETKGKTLEEINADFSGNKNLLRGNLTSDEMPSAVGKTGTSTETRSTSVDDGL